MIRRLCGVMHRMLLQGEQFHWLKEELYRQKLVEYQKIMSHPSYNPRRALSSAAGPGAQREQLTVV